MPAERWARVEAVFHAALACAPHDRQQVLNDACAGDSELRREVEELLAHSDAPTRQVERPIVAVAQQVLQNAPLIARGRRSPFIWVVAGLGAAIALAHVVAVVGLLGYVHPIVDLGFSYGWVRGGPAVTGMTSASSLALHQGDRILAVNGDLRARMRGFGPRVLVHAGTPYRLLVERDGRQLEYTLTASPASLPQQWTVAAVVVSSAVWAAIGLFIGFSKPDLVLARLACIACVLTSAMTLTDAIIAEFEPHSGPFWYLQAALFVVGPWALPVGYHTLCRFPEGVPRSRFWSAFIPIFYAIAALFFLGRDVPHAMILLSSTSLAAAFITHLNGWQPFVERFDPALTFAIGAATIAVIVRNFRACVDPDQVRRIRVFTYSAVIGLLPNIVLVTPFLPTGRLTTSSFALFGRVSDIAMAVAAVGLAYGIVRHQVFDIALVVRRGVQYLLAKNGLRVLVALPLAYITYAIVSHPTQSAIDLIVHSPILLALVAAAATALACRVRVLRWLDARFFCEAVDRDRVLQEAIAAMRELDTMAEITEYVALSIGDTLHPKTWEIWAREVEEDDLMLVERAGSPDGSMRIPKREEPAWLRRLQGELTVPIAGVDGTVLGAVVLGEKKSEVPYSDGDRLLVLALAQQAGIVGDNLRLTRRVGEERRVRDEVLAAGHARRLNLLKECPHCGVCYDSTLGACADDGHRLIVSLPVDRTLDDKYRLKRLVGRGGMGAVYEAEDLRLDRTVAVKIMLRGAFGDPAALHRFEREARASARLHHPNIVSVFDVGRVSDRGAYLVMEYVRGETMRAALNRMGTLPPAIAARWFDQICSAIHEAHHHGIIHRDLKPENVLIVSSDGEQAVVKLVDFGVAKLRPLDTKETPSVTMGEVLGTLGYMSPEQLLGEPVDERTDIFAIGVMAVEALVGRRPFEGKTPAERLMAIMRDTVHLPGSNTAARRLETVVDQCLAQDRLRRFASIADLQADLVPALRAVGLANE